MQGVVSDEYLVVYALSIPLIASHHCFLISIHSIVAVTVFVLTADVKCHGMMGALQNTCAAKKHRFVAISIPSQPVFLVTILEPAPTMPWLQPLHRK